MRLHGFILVASLCGGIASAQSVLDRPKTVETSTRAKKDATPHAPLFVEQKDLPTTSKAAMHETTSSHLFSKSKD